MRFFFFYSLLALLIAGPVFGDCPIPFGGFTARSLDPTTNLLSGMAWTSQGLAVCDHGAGTLLLINNDRSVEVLLDQLNTPVDVMEYGNEWLILQEEEGSLIGVDKKTLHRRIIADGFVHPTAFTIDDRNSAYVTEFESGFLFQVDLANGIATPLRVLFDRPADVLFVKPDTLYVADQVGPDLTEGTVYTLNRSGKILRIENDIIDPTGLAMSPSGELCVSTFSLRDSSHDNRMASYNGGVVHLDSHHAPDKIVSGLLGPTSILFDDEGNLIVMEEPADSIYRYAPSGERTAILEGFAPIDQAVRNNNGDIFVMEKTPLHQIKVMGKDGAIRRWEYQSFKMWDRVKMAADGQGYVYLSDPMSSRIYVYDPMGNPVYTFNDSIPLYMTGVPSGGIFLFAMAGKSFSASLLKPNQTGKTYPMAMGAMFTTGFAKSEDQLVLCLANGDIQEYFLRANERKTVSSGHNRTAYISSALDKNNDSAFWLLDSNSRILFWNGKESIPAAQASEAGVLLPDSSGVLFLGNSGKRFLIQPEVSAVSDWNSY